MPTIEIPLPDELLQLVDERAQVAGLERGAYIREVLSKDVASPSISQILAPFRDQVRNSEISDEELDELFSEAREESYRERNPAKN